MGLVRYEVSLKTNLNRVYFGDESLDPEKSLKRFSEMQSDLNFANGVHDLAHIQARNSEQPTYLYKYSFEKGLSPFKKFYNLSHITGAGHEDELMYLFYAHGFAARGISLPGKTSKERIVIERLMQMWTDFAKTGNPTPVETKFIKTTWKPIKTANELHHLEINEELSPGRIPNAAKCLLWSKPPNTFKPSRDFLHQVTSLLKC